MTGLIAVAGQDIQLHLHPEWTDELPAPPIADAARKRQHLTYYTLDEQTALIGFGRRLLESATGRPVTAFRAGSFAANHDTYLALARNGIGVDSSLNAMADFSGCALNVTDSTEDRRAIGGVQVYPVTVFRDGFGRLRPAQLGASSLVEMQAALLRLVAQGAGHAVLVSHNFEMLRAPGSDPDWTVVRRFEGLCRWLAEHRDLFQVGPLPAQPAASPAASHPRVQVPAGATLRRLLEQARRRLGG